MTFQLVNRLPLVSSASLLRCYKFTRDLHVHENECVTDVFSCSAALCQIRSIRLCCIWTFISLCTVFTVYLFQLAAFCQQFIKEMCYVMLCYVMLCISVSYCSRCCTVPRHIAAAVTSASTRLTSLRCLLAHPHSSAAVTVTVVYMVVTTTVFHHSCVMMCPRRT